MLWVESDEFCQSVITQRQTEGNLTNAPILDDARVIAQFCKDNSVIADGVTGGFPCQGTSCAGLRQGMKDPRTGLVSFLFECFDSVNAQGALVTISNGNGVDSSTHVALNCIIRYAAGGSWSLKMSLASSQSPCMVS